MMKQLLTAADLAPIVRMHTNSIYRLARLGQIRCKKIGASIRFDEDEFMEDISKAATTPHILYGFGSKKHFC